MDHGVKPAFRPAIGLKAAGFIACASECSPDFGLRDALLPVLGRIDDATHAMAGRPSPSTTVAVTCKPTTMIPARLMDNQKMLDQAGPDPVQHDLMRVNQELERRIAERTAALERALSDRELLLRELNHRVKNNLQVVSSILGLQSGHTQNKEVRRQLRDAQSRVTALGVVHDLLHEGLGRRAPEHPYPADPAGAERHRDFRSAARADLPRHRRAPQPDPAGSGHPAVDAGLGAADQRPQARVSQWPSRYDQHHLARSYRGDLRVGCRQRHRAGRRRTPRKWGWDAASSPSSPARSLVK